MSFNDMDPGVCPDGNCPGEAYACFDSMDSLGPIDEHFGLWDPDSALTLDQVVDQHATPFLRFWHKLMDAYEDQYGTEELVKLGMIFEPGRDRDGYYEIEWHEPGDPYSIWYWESGDYVSNWSVEQFFGAENIGAGFATVPLNSLRDRNVLHFYQDHDFDQITDAQIRQAARYLNEAISINEDFTRWVSIAGNIAEVVLLGIAIFTGVGGVVAGVGWALRAAALVALAADVSDAGREFSGYLGVNDGSGVNVLEEAAAFLGSRIDGAEGDRHARVAYHTINVIVGLKGKWRFLAATVPGMAYGSAMLQETEGTEDEFWMGN